MAIDPKALENLVEKLAKERAEEISRICQLGLSGKLAACEEISSAIPGEIFLERGYVAQCVGINGYANGHSEFMVQLRYKVVEESKAIDVTEGWQCPQVVTGFDGSQSN